MDESKTSDTTRTHDGDYPSSLIEYAVRQWGYKFQSVQLKLGDITTAKESVICHQCNCTSGRHGGLAGHIFNTWPRANTHSGIKMPGTISFFPFHASTRTQGILNMYAQNRGGKPTPSEPPEVRLKWFETCLEAIATWAHELVECQTKGTQDCITLAFPFKIGCGLAGGEWKKYASLLDAFASKHKHLLTIVLYQRLEDIPKQA